MHTTIQISNELLNQLKRMKLTKKESYEEVIRDLLEDVSEITEETKKLIRQAEEEVKAGEVYTHSEVKKELGIDV